MPAFFVYLAVLHKLGRQLRNRPRRNPHFTCDLFTAGQAVIDPLQNDRSPVSKGARYIGAGPVRPEMSLIIRDRYFAAHLGKA